MAGSMETIRTHDMHRIAEHGIAAHWRYKETGGSTFTAQQYDEKIAWLRQLLAWKTDVADAVVGLGDLQWIVSYDNVGQIRDIYSGYQRAIYNIGYSARSARQGSEVMFFADRLIVPRMSGPVHVLEEHGAAVTIY